MTASDPYHHRSWPALRRRILVRDHRQCQIQGPTCTGYATTVDHTIPISLGGAWFDEANLRAACAPCNFSRFRTIPIDTGDGDGPSRDW